MLSHDLCSSETPVRLFKDPIIQDILNRLPPAQVRFGHPIQTVMHRQDIANVWLRKKYQGGRRAWSTAGEVFEANP